MNKFIAGFIGTSLVVEALAWAFGGVVSREWIYWAAALIALRIAYLAGKASNER